MLTCVYVDLAFADCTQRVPPAKTKCTLEAFETLSSDVVPGPTDSLEQLIDAFFGVQLASFHLQAPLSAVAFQTEPT